jgi:putative GTP pyrophosphokinase
VDYGDGIAAVSVLDSNKKDMPKPPWGSKGLINRAGETLRSGENPEGVELNAIETWRAAHKYVLNTFQSILRNRRKKAKRKIEIAQRLKRRSTIVDKLFREPKMELARMDDIAGCRLIFPNISSLKTFRRKFLRARFNHKRKNKISKYDYLKHPKPSGYRGVHDIYEYNPNSAKGKPYTGLLLELQYRTFPQHAWASAVELVSRITENQPKFDRGDDRYREFFRLASEVVARVHEQSKSTYPDVSNDDLIKRLEAVDGEIHLIRMLRGLHTVYEGPKAGGNIILQISEAGHLTIHEPGDEKAAIEEYFTLEKENPKDDIVLVNAKSFAEIRSAYRNYFSDPQEFLRYLHEGSIALGGKGCQ